jgi:hypothetical protein
MNRAARISATLALSLLATVSFSPAALAGTGEASRQEVARLATQAEEAFTAGLAAAKDNNNAAACRYFENAAVLWENAIYASLGMMTDPAYDRDEVSRNNDNLQENADSAKKNAKIVCGQ